MKFSDLKKYARRIVSKQPKSAPYVIRVHGDPVLKTTCTPIGEIDHAIKKLAEDMITTMYLAPGVGLAANQIGSQKRIFVYDDQSGDGAQVLINPEMIEISGEQDVEEGCLSVPGLYFPITRGNHVKIKGLDLEGNEVYLDADGYKAQILQHEFDHLEGMLYLKRLTPEHRKAAMKQLRDLDLKSGA